MSFKLRLIPEYQSRTYFQLVLMLALLVFVMAGCSITQPPYLTNSAKNDPSAFYGVEHRDYHSSLNIMPFSKLNKLQWKRYKIATVLVDREYLISERSHDYDIADYYLYLIIKSYAVDKKKVERVLEIFDQNFVGMKKISHTDTVGIIPFSAPFSNPSEGVNIENYDLDISRELIRMYGKSAGVEDAQIAIYGSSSNLYDMPAVIGHFDAIDLTHYSIEEIGNVIEYLRVSFEIKFEDELSHIDPSLAKTGYMRRDLLHDTFSASVESRFTLLGRKVFYYLSKSIDGSL